MSRIKFVKNNTYNFLKSFDDNFVAKIFGLLEILNELGVYLGPSKLKKVNKDIYELRVVGKISIRIFIYFSNSHIYILHAFVKKSQKIPKKELEIAINRLKSLR